MSRIKINAIADQLNVEIDRIIEKAKELGARPKDGSSTITDEVAFKIRASIGVEKSPKTTSPTKSPLKRQGGVMSDDSITESNLTEDMAKVLQEAENALQSAQSDTGEKTKKTRKKLLPIKKRIPSTPKKKVAKKKPLPIKIQKEFEEKRKAEVEAKRKAEEELRLKAEAEEKKRIEEETKKRLLTEKEEQEKREAEERRRVEAEIKAKVEAKSKKKSPPEKDKKKKKRKQEQPKVVTDAISKIKVAETKQTAEVGKPKKVATEKPKVEKKETPKKKKEEIVEKRQPKTHQNPDVLAKMPKAVDPVKVEVSKPKKVSPVKLPPISKERLEKLRQPLRPPPGLTGKRKTRPKTGGTGFSKPPTTTTPPSDKPVWGKKKHKRALAKKKEKQRREREFVPKERVSREAFHAGKGHFLVKKRSISGDFEESKENKSLPLTIDVFAKTAGVPEKRVMAFMLKNGIVPNPEEELCGDILAILSKEFGLETSEEGELSSENLIPRSPIVTVMGHVDHGKTTLLDYIRHARVAEGEAGGITQDIGAYKVQVSDLSVVFIDTPGHEAFTAMRREGASVTDVVILVIDATEGIKEQTKEAINMAKSAKVTIVVAANKMDLPGANIDRLKGELAEIDLTPEDWGGDTIVVPISAKTGEGVDSLLEMVSLQADVLELKMNKSGKLAGTIIESHMDKFVGPLASAIIQSGSLKIGDYVEAGTSWGRIKALYDDRGNRIKKASCITPVKIMGFDSVPKPGQVLLASNKSRRRKTEKKASVVISDKTQDVATPSSIEELFAAYDKEEATKLNVVIKTDSQGSLDAVKFALSKIKIKDVPVNIVYSGIGVIGENDVLLSEASDSLLIGFNVKPENQVKKTAKQKGVQVLTFNIIFELTDAVTNALKLLVKPEFQDVLIGKAEVREIFSIDGVGNIAGCLVHEGKVRSDSKAKIIRNRLPLHETMIDTLKHFKDDVSEVKSGYECGIRLKDYEDIKTGDILEFYEVHKVE
jgi:translation initiation factor IF-2